MMGALEVVQPGIPPALAELGVKMVERDGWRAINIPDSIRENFTPISPVSSFAQVDPLYTPSARVVRIDPNDKRLCYEDKSKRDERALAKPALLLLAEAGGITHIETSLIERKFLKDDQIGWQATVYIRRSDGTLTSHMASRTMSETAEKAAIEGQVRGSQYNQDKTEPQIQNLIALRVAKEYDHWSAKCETKAILRAIRGVLQIAHSYTLKELSKPFIVVGYSMTPDYNDPETRRMLIEAGIGASARMYGLRAELDELAPQRALGVGTDAPPSAAIPPVGSALGELPSGDAPAAASEKAPEAPATQEPQGEPVTGANTTPPASEAAAPSSGLGDIELDFGKHRGKTLAKICSDGDQSYIEWLSDNARDPQMKQQCADFLASMGGES